MFDIRLRLYSPSGERGRVLRTLSLSFTSGQSERSTVKFQTSARVAGALPERFVVAVETSTGGRYTEAKNARLIASQDDRDDADPSGLVSFTAKNYPAWLLQLALVGDQGAKDGYREFTDASAGGILRALFQAASARGAIAGVSFPFTAAADSQSVPWPTSDRLTVKYPTEQTLDKVLAALTKESLVEWWTEGMAIRLGVPGTGIDRSSTVVLGAKASRIPRRTSIDDIRTHFVVVPDGSAKFILPNAGAPAEFGRLEGALSLSGVEDRPTAERLAASHAEQARAPQREDSVTYPAAGASWLPFAHYDVGDVVTRRSRTTREARRVVEIIVTKNESGIETSVTLGHRFRSVIARLAGRASAGSVGSVVGGSGLTVPPPQPSYRLPPKQPQGLQADSNVGYWGEGNVPYARAVVSWVPVTQATDDSPITVAGYDVWVAFDAGEWAQLASTQVAQVDLDRLRPGSLVRVMVAARSAAGGVSVESSVLQFTAATPITATAAPTAPVLESKLGLVSARWDGTLVDALVTPSLTHVAAEWTTDPLEGDWAAFGSPLRARGSATLTGRPPGELVYVSLVAVSLNGTRTRSEVRTVEVVGVAGPDIEAGTIRAAHIEAGSITANELSPSIGDDLDLSANGTITLIAGQAAAAQGAAASAAETAGEAQATANGAAEQLAITQTSFQVRPDGAYVTSPQSEYALALKAGQIEIQENGAVATYWNAGQMVVPQLVSPRVTLGNHQIEAQAGGHTIFRAL